MGKLKFWSIIMSRKVSRKPEWQIKISSERIKKLLQMSKEYAIEKPGLSKRYAELAKKIGMRYNVRFSKAEKRSVCKKCNLYLIPGKTSIVRTSKKQQAVVTTCKGCGFVRRSPYRREKRSR